MLAQIFTFAFPWQRWLRERATMLRYADIVNLVLGTTCVTLTNDSSRDLLSNTSITSQRTGDCN